MREAVRAERPVTARIRERDEPRVEPLTEPVKVELPAAEVIALPEPFSLEMKAAETHRQRVARGGRRDELQMTLF
jgi:hypothetical protein